MIQPPPLRVLVMHGDHLIDAGLAFSLTRHADIEILAACPAGMRDSDLPGWLAGQGVDIVITDHALGLSLAAALQLAKAPSRRGSSRIVIVTSHTTQTEIRQALKQGVSGYLTVDSPAEEVIDAVRKVHRGMRHVSETLARIVVENLLEDALTPRESEVLRLAAQGYGNKLIATRLRVEPATVRSHMKAVLDKLSAGNRTEAVVIANQRGLVALEGAARIAHAGDARLHTGDTTTHRWHPPTPSMRPAALHA